MRLILLAGLAAGILLGGCTPITHPGHPELDPLPAGRHYEILPLGDAINYFRFLSPPRIDPAGQEPMTVMVPIILRGTEEVNIQYRFQFFDDHSRPSGADQPWVPMHLLRATPMYIQATAPGLEAHDWRLLIRRVRKT